MKGDIPAGLFYVFALVLGLIATVFISSLFTGSTSAESDAFLTSTRLSLNINSLSSIERGYVKLLSDRKFDIEIEKRNNGYYASVTPYTREFSSPVQTIDEEKGEPHSTFIFSYPNNIDFRKTFNGVTDICIKKDEGKYPEVLSC
jgi:hypothetical protein